MKAKILEIFQSIQGEGIYSGVKQIFVRFFECNMHCVWCDTPHSIGDTSSRYDEYSLEKLTTQLDDFDSDCHSVSLTGGEPLLQKDFIKELLPYIKKKKMKSYLETNGIFYKELEDIVKDIDIIAMDIKLPSSTKCKEFWKEHEEFLKVSQKSENFIKTVITSDTDKSDVQRAVEIVNRINPNTTFILQPNTYELGNGVMTKCLEFHNYCREHLPNVRIMPQMHKMMKVR